MNKGGVLITGGAVRVGRAIALRLADAGYPIAIHYRQSADKAEELASIIKDSGGHAVCVQADFADSFDAKALLAEANSAIGSIHHLVNNASVFVKDTLDTVSNAPFHSHMNVNLFAPLALIQAFAQHISNSKLDGTNIINIGDGAKGWSLSSKHLSYALSKVGLMELAPMLAIELAPAIRINNVAPGPSMPGALDEHDTFERLAQRIPVGHVSSADEICDAVDFLMSAASVTGQTIWLGGGLQCHQTIDFQLDRN